MTTDKVIYETGATSHAVNDLILFTDNTRELAKKRDAIYKIYVSAYKAEYKGNVSWIEFHPLFIMAVKQYCKELSDNRHVKSIKDKGMTEYCTLYANDFENWKQEHNTKVS